MCLSSYSSRPNRNLTSLQTAADSEAAINNSIIIIPLCNSKSSYTIMQKHKKNKMGVFRPKNWGFTHFNTKKTALLPHGFYWRNNIRS
jgi:hypothetical protein